MRVRARGVLRIAIVCTLLAAPAAAQGTDAQTRAAARQLAQEGLSLYQQGKYAEALERLNRAADLVPVPTLHLHTARALEKLGRWVDANERYLAALRAPAVGDVAEQERAQQLARSEQQALYARIPKLTITVSGDATGVEVTLDGRSVPPALLGAAQPVDPGSHELLARRGQWQEARQITLEPEAAQTVVFEPPAAEAPAAAAASKPAPQPVAGPRTDPVRDSPPARSDPGAQQRTIGWVAIGVGGAGVVFGAVAGGLAVGRKDTLDDDCPDRQCGPSQYDEVDAYDRLRLISTIGFTVGAVATAGGIALLLTAPEERQHVRIGAGPRGVSVGGRF